MKIKKHLPFIILPLVILIDQVSKILIRYNFGPGSEYQGQHINLLGNFFWLNFHENKGVAFGLFSKLPTSVTIPIFVVISLLAIGVIIKFYKELPKDKLLPKISLMMILGGAVGNLIDRIFLGKVTDFLDLAVYKNGLYKNIWPIFNMADSFIVVGVSILVIIMIFEKKDSKSTEAAKETEIEKPTDNNNIIDQA